MKNVNDALEAIRLEHSRATNKFGSFASYHEGHAVLKEEVDKLWDEIKGAQRPDHTIKEATQVGAMALRFIVDMLGLKE